MVAKIDMIYLDLGFGSKKGGIKGSPQIVINLLLLILQGVLC